MSTTPRHAAVRPVRPLGLAAAATAVATIAALLSAPGILGVSHAATVIDVTTTAAGVDPNDGECSLAEAIYAANLDDNKAVTLTPPEVFDTTECTAGSGADTISLPAGAVFSFNTSFADLHNPLGATATPLVFTPIVIEGNGARLERAANAPSFRAFAVGDASVDTNPGGTPNVVTGMGDLTLRDVYVKNFFVHGGDGGVPGGGGGLGAGGALYVRGGTVTVESSTFEGNRAEGGNGGRGGGPDGGGGGGLSGDGGGNTPGYGGSGAGGGSLGNGGNDGGGGGGTVTDGEVGEVFTSVARGGEACGGNGGYTDFDSDDYIDGTDGCDGGGGGGGPLAQEYSILFLCCHGHPGAGGYGGGGGGGAGQLFYDFGVNGASGGFGGGGGGAGATSKGGQGGFGAGGGGSVSDIAFGGTFGGHGGRDHFDPALSAGAGGGGAGLGGAIFSDNGTVVIRNSTFTGNSVSHGFAGDANTDHGVDAAANGADAGGAVFAVDGDLTLSNSTVSGNESTGSAAGVAMYKSTRGNSADLHMTDTIVAGNTPASGECTRIQNDDGDRPSGSGSGNLFTNNDNCPGESVTGDPLLSPLALETPGNTPTMAIDDSSPAYDAADDDVCEQFDQRGVSRPRSLHCDIGAYEYVEPSANLTVTTTALGAAVAGSDLDFLVEVSNDGPTAAENVTLADVVPSGTTYVAMPSAHGFTCAQASGTVTCTDPVLLEGSQAALKLTVHIPATATDGTAVKNAVTVSSTTPDPVPGNNSDSWTSTVVTRADLSVTKSGPSAPTAGTGVSYTITVANAGPSDARTVAMSDTTPAGTTFTSLVAPTGWTCTKPTAGTAGPSTISCSKTTAMAAAGMASFTLNLGLGADAVDGSQLCNTASASTATNDPVSSNNSSTTCGTVKAIADLSLGQTASTSGKAGKGTATFVSTVTNNGPSDSQNVSLSVTSSLFTGPAPSIVTTDDANCSVSGQTVTCSWTSIPSGATRSATISVPWRSSVGSVCAAGTVTSGTTDPNAINNTASGCVGKKKK